MSPVVSRISHPGGSPIATLLETTALRARLPVYDVFTLILLAGRRLRARSLPRCRHLAVYSV